MLKENIYIGNINIIENGKSEIYLINSPLLSLGDGNYISLEWIISLKDYLKFCKGLITGNHNNDLIIRSDIPKNGIYIDKSSLMPFYIENEKGHVNLYKLNEDAIMDYRIPRGIYFNNDKHAIAYTRRHDPRK